MKPLPARLQNGTGETLATTVWLADSWWSRFRGLIARPPLGDSEALWIRPCSQVHTHFMRHAITVVFLDSDLRVLRVIPEMTPWRISPWVRGARSVLEFSARRMLPVAEGQRLHLRH